MIADADRLICIIDGCTNVRESKGKNRTSGSRTYGPYCTKHRRRYHLQGIDKSKCERCGFEAEDPCQMDVDHVDGNAANNDRSNLMVLCANCHRLKTKQSKDWEDRTAAETPEYLPLFEMLTR